MSCFWWLCQSTILIRLYNKTDNTTSISLLLREEYMVDKRWFDLISHAGFSFNRCVQRKHHKPFEHMYLWFVYTIEFIVCINHKLRIRNNKGHYYTLATCWLSSMIHYYNNLDFSWIKETNLNFRWNKINRLSRELQRNDLSSYQQSIFMCT